MKKIELLAPAKNLESGIAAINFGADAVYIGSPKFGARLAAGNSIDDIIQLTTYAHRFYSKVYVTINTILYDNELDEVERTIHQLYNAGVDAIIIQDMGILEMTLPPIPLFASTQTHNYDWQKIKFLEDVGLQRIILARELSLNQIHEIRSKTTIDLEFFVHGALCVSFSGQCYFSHAINKGSANRGACAQACRAYYSLKDKNGKTLIKDKHLLSLKDLNLTNYISDLLDAGISSFKIEGRLKDIDYVKNITANYRKAIDIVLEGREGYQKSSSGILYYDFNPDPEKTFNRGYTDYFLTRRNKEIASPDTQKSIGKFLGITKSLNDKFFILDRKTSISSGDGICFFNKQGKLQGTKIYKVDGDKIFPESILEIIKGIQIFRNFDIRFSKQLSSSKTERKISVTITIKELDESILIVAKDEDNNKISYIHQGQLDLAKNQARAFETIKTQLNKTGDSIFKVNQVNIELKQAIFFPISELNNLRRIVLEKLEEKRRENYSNQTNHITKNNIPYPDEFVDYKGNVLNNLAIQFYKRHGVNKIDYAFEAQTDFSGKEIMITKHCVKYQMGACESFEMNPKKISEPLFMEDNNRKYKLEFDCKNCQMKIIML